MASFKVLLLTLITVLMGAQSSSGTTPYSVGPGRVMKDFTVSGGLSATSFHVIDLPILARATNSGSATIKAAGYDGTNGTKYASICIPNPLRNMGTGSGRTFLNRGSGGILEVVYQVEKGGAGVGGDLGFVRSCGAGTGSQLINDVCTATGCTSSFIADDNSFPIWQGQEFIKLGLRGTPGGGYKASLFLKVTDAAGSR